MDLRDYRLFEFSVKFTQSLSRWLDQDTCVPDGTRIVVKRYRVLARNKNMAVAYALDACSHNYDDRIPKPELSGEVISIPIDGIVLQAWFNNSDEPKPVG